MISKLTKQLKIAKWFLKTNRFTLNTKPVSSETEIIDFFPEDRSNPSNESIEEFPQEAVSIIEKAESFVSDLKDISSYLSSDFSRTTF